MDSYCGTTKDFCGKKTVNRPSCSSKSGPMRRVVGYIEGWASTRSCDKFTPSDIPDGVYTHINFAFASIDPKTFEIVPASSKDPALYRELTNKKKTDPKLKVFIAIGGWAFNDPGPTVTTFSDIARSDTNQRAFIKSLISFMATYGFDGVDIDWEYPAADDREGRVEDFDNLPKFLSNLKRALKQSGERNGLSIAIPASYWYLQHFDLEKISKHVDYFNVMTYDFHGAWDTPKSWLGNHLNSHTNLTEIKDAFDLLWRNNVDPDQVNMGLAFYARTFSASSSSCMSPGCLFDAGGPSEPCTNAVGVMSNPEIMRKLAGKASSGVLDKTAAIKTLKFGSTWLTYDDVDTWKLKLEFARSQCLGGAMVWAISQDTSDGKFSMQLQQATGYKSKGVSFLNSTTFLGSGVFIETDQNEPNGDASDNQCHWTNCGQKCPDGWAGVRRRDSDKKTAIMTDDTGCDDNRERTFCCPPGDQPYCQWQFFNNGYCIPGCGPSAGMEVGSSGAKCGSSEFAQTACCKGDTSGLDVYRQYEWYGLEKECARDEDDSPCGWDATYDQLLTESWDGSGDQNCYDSKGNRGPRPLCENTRDTSKPHFSNCIWSDDYYLGRTDTVSTGTCNSNCPKGKIKVALQSKNNKCGKGTSAYCCDVTISEPIHRLGDDEMEDAIKEWVKNPTCPDITNFDEDKLSSRSLENSDYDTDESASDLVKRAGLDRLAASLTVVQVIEKLMTFPKTSRATRDINAMVTKYFKPIWPHITGAYVAGRLWELRDSGKTTLIAAWDFVCNIDAEEKKAEKDGKAPKGTSFCHIPMLDTYDPGSLQDPRGGRSDADISDIFGPIGTINDSGDLKFPFDEMLWSSDWVADDALEKRGKTYGKRREFEATCPDGITKVAMKSFTYPSGDNGDHLADKNGDDNKYWVDNLGDCFSAIVMDNGYTGDGNQYISEHILELQSVPMFMEYTMGVQKRLRNTFSPSGLPLKAPFNPEAHSLLTCGFWANDFTYGFYEWQNKYGNAKPVEVLFELLGSTANSIHMVNTEAKFNGKKGLIWAFNEPVADSTWTSLYARTDDATALRAFEQLMLVEQVFPYLTNPSIKTKLLSAHHDVIEFLDEYESLYRTQYPNNGPIGLSDMWRNFMTELLSKMQQWTNNWLERRTGKMLDNWHAEYLRRQAATRALTAAGSPAAAAAAAAEFEALKHLNDAYKHNRQYSAYVNAFNPESFLTGALG
ncbi:hypothetical protein FPSE5266_05536 [Fusarium pseudograminearum]|nr:hypothetical protein FPSE5266_05536 [Fusarium pseudograminearum]